jgi:hypothetical protein
MSARSVDPRKPGNPLTRGRCLRRRGRCGAARPGRASSPARSHVSSTRLPGPPNRWLSIGWPQLGQDSARRQAAAARRRRLRAALASPHASYKRHEVPHLDQQTLTGRAVPHGALLRCGHRRAPSRSAGTPRALADRFQIVGTSARSPSEPQ